MNVAQLRALLVELPDEMPVWEQWEGCEYPVDALVVLNGKVWVSWDEQGGSVPSELVVLRPAAGQSGSPKQ